MTYREDESSLTAASAACAPPLVSGPIRLVEMSMGLPAAQMLITAHELGLFAFLSSAGGADIAGTAAGLRIADRPAEILLTACAALELVVKDGPVFRNADIAEELLVPGRDGYFGGYLRMLKYTNESWARLEEAIRSDSPARYEQDKRSGIFAAGTRPQEFWDGLFALAAATARVVAGAVDFSGTSSLLDVGGGDAAFPIELCRRHPGLRATVYDLPYRCESTQQRVRAAGLAGRIGTWPGDFFADPGLPTGHDTILLSAVLHDWDEKRARELLAKCFQALPAGGLIVICDHLVNDAKTGPLAASMLSAQMLIGNWGRNYTAAEYGTWLLDAGFSGVHTVRFSAAGANGAVLGRKPHGHELEESTRPE